MKIYTTKKLMEKEKWNEKHLTNSKATRKRIKEQKLCGTNRKQTAKKATLNSNISVIVLNVTGLSITSKRQRLSDWIKK